MVNKFKFDSLAWSKFLFLYQGGPQFQLFFNIYIRLLAFFVQIIYQSREEYQLRLGALGDHS